MLSNSIADVNVSCSQLEPLLASNSFLNFITTTLGTADLACLGAPNHARGFVVFHKPFHALLHGLLEWSELEVWQIFSELDI